VKAEKRDVSLIVTAALAALTVVPTGSCEVTPHAVPATVRDSASIRIVEHQAEPGALATWRLSETPQAVIGALQDEAAHQFTEVRGAVRLSSGRIVVADWGTREARYFDAQGNHVRTVGGGGQGPGEVRFLYAVDRVRGDTLVVGGWPIGSRYWFDENGEHVRDEALGPWFPGMLGRTLPDGHLIIDTFEFGSYGNTIERWVVDADLADLRPEGVIELVASSGDVVDTISVIRGQRHHKAGTWPRVAALALPFSPVSLVAWSADRVYVGHTEEPEVRAYDLHGQLHTIIRWAPRPVPVSAQDRQSFATNLIDKSRRPEMVPVYNRWLSEIEFPEFKPVFAALIADDAGYLWIRDSAPGDAATWHWTIHGPDGVAVARMETVAGLDLLDVDRTHAIGKLTDTLGIERVHSYPVNRSRE